MRAQVISTYEGVKEKSLLPVGQRLQSLLSSPQRLIWAVRVRSLAIAGFVALSLVAHRFGLFVSLQPIWIVAVVGGGLNALNGWCVRRRRYVLPVSAVAIPMDHVFSTYLIMNTGAVHSPFLVVYAVQVVATAMLVDTVVAIVSAVLAVVLWLSALWLQGIGYLNAPPLFALGGEPSLAVYQGTLAAFLFYCLVLLVFLGGYISERLRASERQLGERNRSLEEAVASLRETHEQLRRAYARQREAEAQLVHSEKMRGLGALVAGIAHELNNPISFVAGNVEHLRNYVGRLRRLLAVYDELSLPACERQRIEQVKSELQMQLISDDLPTLLDDCEEGARRTQQIVLGLRSFSRIDSGEGWQVADIRAGIDATLSVVGNRFRDRITVHKNYGDVPEVECLLGQLNQVFLNLLVNAADACPPSGGDVWIDVQRASLDGKDAVAVQFRDNGEGIPAAIQARIFEPFFTTKPVGQGTGLGLSVSYGIVQRHHGTLSVQSQPGVTTTFVLKLPVRR